MLGTPVPESHLVKSMSLMAKKIYLAQCGIFPPYSAPHFFNSFSLEIGSEIVLTSSELISTSSELISTSSELISTSVECLKMGFSV